jgi:ABC-2 type transport system ATP-binding protein
VLSSQQLYEVEKASGHVIFLKNGQPLHQAQDAASMAGEAPGSLILEFESEWKQEALRRALEALGLEKLQINGGTYVACFPAPVSQEDFLRCVLKEHVPLRYFRNISRSTRRFFIS